MKSANLAGAAALVLALGVASAAAAAEPPMNSFNSAFYVCDRGGTTLLVSYDSHYPKTAKLTPSGGAGEKTLPRVKDPKGVKFAADGASFWTDGKTVAVEGLPGVYVDCQRKS